MIGSLLIANRGEIACRIIRTARRLSIRTVAVFSDADAAAMHVREADEAVHIGRSAARESYLSGEKIIAAAKQSGAEAIHPGYGFLSENAEFAEAVRDAGLIWVGPDPASIRAMGLKDAAKRLMAEAGVPVTPGYLGDDQSQARLHQESDAIGYPVLIKAIAGGGGKGMRRVNRSEEFDEMLASCRREAQAAFGDDRVIIEKYIEHPRHVEVQIFGDMHGNAIHLFERDCSLQRRHQKVIEEAPAPGMDAATREAICGAAVKAARAVDYVGAGTVEFIADGSEGLRADRFWFMEMNTRLQVEHPVTEEITGEDLVEWQLRVASGEKLPRRQDELSIHGWAVEARLYAEDPQHDFLPSIGRLDHVAMPQQVRIETGFGEGDRISPYYDPMIAKLIAIGQDRNEAIDRLAEALGEVEVWPVKTNAGFLRNLVSDPDFAAGRVDTSFIPARIDRIMPPAQPDEAIWNLAAVAMLGSDFGPASSQDQPWQSLPGFRINGSGDIRVTLQHQGEVRTMEVSEDAPVEGMATAHGDTMLVFSGGQSFAFTLPGVGGSGGGGAVSDGSLVSPMPGRIIAFDARTGDAVTKGQKLVTIEAMKMEHSLSSPFDGTVAEVLTAEGDQVTEGKLLLRIEKAA